MAHIILIGPAYPFRGGLATFNESLVRAWQNMGHQVELITFTTQYPAILFPGKTQLVQGPGPYDLIITRKLSSVNPLSWVSLGFELKEKKPDFILFRYWLPFMGPSFGTVARLAKSNGYTKIIALTDNVIPHEARPGDTAFTKYFLKSCQAFVAMSETVMQDLRKFEKHKPAILQPHPIYNTYGDPLPKQVALRRLGLPAEPKYILFFGFIRNYKGLDLLLQAMKDQRLQEQNIKLLVAGEFYEDPEPYYALIKEAELQDQVVLATDYIPDEKVALYFSAADLVVQPYRRATQSGVTQIAFHFEKPMVVTNVGGLKELIKDGEAGYVVEVEPQRIADAILKFYQGGREEEMKRFIKQEKEKYTWEALGSAIVSLREQIL